MIKGVLLPYRFSQSFSLVASDAIVVRQTNIRSIFHMLSETLPAEARIVSPIPRIHIQVDNAGTAILGFNSAGLLRISDMLCKLHRNSCSRQFSTAIQPEISWEGSSRETLLSKLGTALKDRRVDEAWEAFNDFKRLHGFPMHCLVRKLIIELSYSYDSVWLRKAYELVLIILKEKSNLLHHDFMSRLALALARAQMPIPASTVLRLMLEKDKFPPVEIWSTVLLHMVKSRIGAYLASDILVEICDYFLHHMENAETKISKRLRLINPNTTIFNLILNACLQFGSTLKAQQIIDLMPRTGVVADAGSIVIMALIHDMNGQRDDLKKVKAYIDGVPNLLDHHYQNFYDSLLNLHFKFNDIDAAAELMFDLYRRRRSHHCSGGSVTNNLVVQKPCIVPIGSPNFKTGLMMQIEPELLKNDIVVDMEKQSKLVILVDGKLSPSNKAFAKLINGYTREKKVGELSNLLIGIRRELGLSAEASLISDVIYACIRIGWLETAHDILDDMESACIPIGAVTYNLLLRAYCKGNLLEEAKVLLKQMRKAGLFVNLLDEKVISTCLLDDGTPINPLDTNTTASVRKLSLAECLIREIKEQESMTSPLVYEINSSIYFFCKAKMMEDALSTFRRMQEMGIRPTVQTFSYLVNGYSSLGMYREITILWGEIRRKMDDGILAVDRDLFECLLWNFIRGGYFERVMEVVNYMMKHNMYIDKWKYKREFLKLHKNLYRSLKASQAKTEAQSKRLEHVRAFRRWAGIE